MGENESLSEIQDKELSALGLEKSMRRNIVIALIVIQFGAIGTLFQQNKNLQREIIQIRTAQADSSNAQYARLLSKVEGKLLAVQEQAHDVVSNISKTDSLQKKLLH